MKGFQSNLKTFLFNLSLHYSSIHSWLGNDTHILILETWYIKSNTWSCDLLIFLRNISALEKICICIWSFLMKLPINLILLLTYLTFYKERFAVLDFFSKSINIMDSLPIESKLIEVSPYTIKNKNRQD